MAASSMSFRRGSSRRSCVGVGLALDELPLLLRRDQHGGEELREDVAKHGLAGEQCLRQVLPNMELARQNGGVLHDLAHVGAPLDPRYIMRDIFGIEDEEHVHVFPLVGEQILRPLDQVQAEVHAVGGARFDLRREGVITDAVGLVLVLREGGNDEELGPLEARAGQRLELQRPYLVLALTVDTGAHKPELGLDLQKHVADHVAGEAVFAVPAVAAFEGVVAHEPEYARLRRNLAVVVFELDVPRDAPPRAKRPREAPARSARPREAPARKL